MDGVMLLVGLVLGLVLLDVLALRFGADTRFPRDGLVARDGLPWWW